MVVDQRNAGASVTPSSGAYTFTVDRFSAYVSQASKLTVQQNAGSVTPPIGFVKYLGVTSSSSYSITSSDIFLIKQSIEGLNGYDLDWGTANAKTVTLSFWVRSSLTGTFGGAIDNAFAGSAWQNYAFSYSISTANTWEYKTITISGPTTGTWNTNTAQIINMYFGLGVGSSVSNTSGSWTTNSGYSATGATSVVGTSGATWYVTGVQFEVGSTATPFERRLYGQELANCYRYYQQLNFGAAIGVNGMGLTATKYAGADSAIANAQLLAPMRTTPTITKSSSTCRFVSSGGIGDLTAVVAGTFGLNGPIWVVGTNNAIPAGSNGWIDEVYSIYITAEL
jgi:hypothetical protein